MAQHRTQPDLVPMEDLIVSNTMQLDTLYQLLIEKGYFTEAEFLVKFKAVQADYQSRSVTKH